MFDPKSLLNDLLGSQIPGTGSTVRGAAGKATQLAKDNPLAAGALVAVLLGTGAGRELTGTALKLDDCPRLIDAWAEAALAVRKDVIVLCHGGPIAMPNDAAYILKTCGHCHGFYGASSMERLPTEIALTEQTRKFKTLSF